MDIRNIRKIAETNREGTTVEYTRKWRVTANAKEVRSNRM